MKLAFSARKDSHAQNQEKPQERKKPRLVAARQERELKIEDWMLDIRKFILSKYQFPPDEVDDIVQDVALRVISKRETNPYVPSRGSISTYLWWNIRSCIFLRLESRKTIPTTLSYEETFVEQFQERPHRIPTQTPLHDSTDRRKAMQTLIGIISWMRGNEPAEFPRPSAILEQIMLGWSLIDMLRYGWTDGERIVVKADGLAPAGFIPLSETTVNISTLKQAKRQAEDLASRFSCEYIEPEREAA